LASLDRARDVPAAARGGIDSPTGTVLVLLSLATGPAFWRPAAVPNRGADRHAGLTAATVLSGASLYGLGFLPMGRLLPVRPSCVVGGFSSPPPALSDDRAVR